MARQMGQIPLKGTIDGITFYYHPDDGHLARAKSSLDKDRVMRDKKFQNFIHSGQEFKETTFAGKLLRKSLSKLLFPIADGKLSARMNATILQSIRADAVSDFGTRRFDKGQPEVLQGFEFNVKLPLETVFTGDVLIVRNKNNDDMHVSIPSFAVARQLQVPTHATHFQFVGGRMVIDFDKGAYKSVFGETSKMAVDFSDVSDIHFSFPSIPLHGTGFIFLGVVFWGDLKKMPRTVMSQRKRKELNRQIEADGTVQFTGALKIMKVIPGVPRVEDDKPKEGTQGDGWEMDGLGIA
jgi:hypothetical protein